MTSVKRAVAAVLAASLGLLVGVLDAVPAQAVTAATKQAFVEKMAPAAQQAQRESGVPASVLIAGAIANSDWGTSTLAASGNVFATRCSAKLTAVQFARLLSDQVGKPYVLGAEAAISNPDPPKFDCSELVQWSYGRAGTTITDLAAAQYDVTRAVAAGTSPAVGDLVFLRNNPARRNGIGHVAVLSRKLASGDWEIIEARGRAYGVVKTTLSYWRDRKYYAGLRRYPALAFAGREGVTASAAGAFQNGCVTVSGVKYAKYGSLTDAFRAEAAAITYDTAYKDARDAMGASASPAFVAALAKAERPQDAADYARTLNDLIAQYDLRSFDIVPVAQTLVAGAKGAKATAVQYLLKAAGYPVKLTDLYDSATVKAVTAYQAAKRLHKDGEAGTNTIGSLGGTLRSGSSGDRVRALQVLLAATGEDVKVTGTLDAATLTALKNFQAATELDVTGIVRHSTWARLMDSFTPAARPTITGTAQVGATLTAVPGTWNPGRVTLSYQWLRAGKPIDGATDAAYIPTADDLGVSLSVTVTGRKGGYATTTRRSAATGAVRPGTLQPTTPTIAGKAQVGEKLTATSADWKPGTVSLAYQWRRNGKAIAGATGTTYQLLPADAGTIITVTVTGTRPGYATATTTSAGTKPIVLTPLVTTVPKITGTPKVGKTLSATVSGWAPDGLTLSYRWYRSGTAIKGATRATYRLTTADRGKRIVVKVTGRAPNYATVTRSSASVKIG